MLRSTTPNPERPALPLSTCRPKHLAGLLEGRVSGESGMGGTMRTIYYSEGVTANLRGQLRNWLGLVRVISMRINRPGQYQALCYRLAGSH